MKMVMFILEKFLFLKLHLKMVMCIFYKFLLMSQNFQSLHQIERRQENQCGSLTKCIMIIGPQLNQLVDKMTMVKCRICSTIKRRNKLMVPKLDCLIKHWKVKKCTLAKLGLVSNNIFWNLLTNMYKMKSCMCPKGLKMLLFNLRMERKMEKKYIYSLLYCGIC
jgi:hypothetical protein